MRCRTLALLFLVGASSFVGCGGSKTSAPTAGTSGAVPSDPIARVVYEFFDAARVGRTDAAKQCLTPLALQRITAHDMNIAPPGSSTSSFQVGQVTTREDDHALVSLIWTDLDGDGKPYNENILCELRQIDGQWRICGMAQDQGPGLPPVVMDFESLEGIAPDEQPKTLQAPGAAATAPAPAGPAKEVAQDPFQQPVQR